MRHRLSDRLRSVQLAGMLALAALTTFGVSSAGAQYLGAPGSKPEIVRQPGPRAAVVTTGSGPYYIEFRSRFSWDYGHTYIVHGRVGEAPNHASVAGLSPVGDDATAWVIGHYIPVPAETGWTDGDLEDKYVTSRYRVLMSKDQYDRIMSYVRDLQSRSHTWSAELYNCNAFVGDIAREMGQKVPSSTLIYPKIFINHLRMMNTNNPNADETLVSDNVKEMSNPTRDGRAIIVSGVRTIHPDGTPATDVAAATPPRPTTTPKVSIGAVRVTSKTTNPDAAAGPSR
ncbi:MAG TPA: hypothetical protein VE396_08360 [Xanthobacteraceae bacterium]|nr:hypothetical protein [Xanthobacteraceae bacterium]